MNVGTLLCLVVDFWKGNLSLMMAISYLECMIMSALFVRRDCSFLNKIKLILSLSEVKSNSL